MKLALHVFLSLPGKTLSSVDEGGFFGGRGGGASVRSVSSSIMVPRLLLLPLSGMVNKLVFFQLGTPDGILVSVYVVHIQGNIKSTTVSSRPVKVAFIFFRAIKKFFLNSEVL